jgi:ribosome-binding factor A
MSYRKEKIEELIKRLIADFLLKEIKDPRVGFVSISQVSLSKDNSFAQVGISILGSPRDIRKSLEGLKSAQGYIQHYLAKNLHMRNIPKIEFKLDSSVSDGVKMVDLIDSLQEGPKDPIDE